MSRRQQPISPAAPADVPPPAGTGPSRLVLGLAGAALGLAALLAYANSFSAPFVFDDKLAISDNPSIRQLWPPWGALSPSLTSAGANGRPLVNLSLAVNYALGGLDVRSYHLLNLLLHVAAGLVLFGLVRRTLLLPVLRGRFGRDAASIGFVTTLVWTVHPLLTESVTCVVQRNEIMVGICHLLVLYGLVRAADSATPRRWLAVSFTAGVLGVFCKENMASAPLLAVAYQAVLIDGSWRAAWRRRGGFFALLALSWVPLAWLVAGNATRDSTVGFGLGIAWWEYALTQCRALIHYLALSFWPHPLVLDYGKVVVRHAAEVWVQGLGLLGLLAVTGVAGLRRLPAFVPALLFWAVLAPSSSFVPLTTQTIAEHRMYLPLAAVAVLTVCGAYALAGRRSLAGFGVLAVVLAVATARRNEDYRSALSIWSDTVAKAPGNARAQTNLGSALADLNRTDEALQHTRRALELDPDFAGAHFNLGSMYDRVGRKKEAIPHYEDAIRLQPTMALAHYNLGVILVQQTRWAEAEEQFKTVLQLAPTSTDAHLNLANILVAQARHAEAVPHFETVVQATPASAPLRLSLATALAFVGRPAEAIAQFETGLQLDPNQAEAHFRLGALLAKSGRRDAAVEHYEAALRLSPNYADAHLLLGLARLQAGRRDEARQEFEAALRARPDFPDARRLLEQLGPRQP